jgi:hypothetical protein
MLQSSFKMSYLLADSTLGEVQLVGCPSKAHMTGSRFEALHGSC